MRDVITGATARDWYFLPGEYDDHDPVANVARFLESLDKFTDLTPDEQVNSVIPHANNVVMRTEHLALFDLVRYSNVTHTAIASGDWTNPRIWPEGRVPPNDANVLIPHHVDVTVDAEVPQRLHTIRVDGGLHFATDRDTRLAVDTLIVSHQGVLSMGTQRQPISPHVSAELLITDSGPIDRRWDPFAFSRGAIVHGKATIHGAEKTPFLPLASLARRGARWLDLAEVPVNWQVGDQLLLAGTHRTEQQDEELEILEIDAARIRVRPLEFHHRVAHRGLAVHVANLTRNATIVSENTEENRAHLMFMHTRNVDLTRAARSPCGLFLSSSTTPGLATNVIFPT